MPIVNGRAITFEDAACIKNGKLKTYAYSSVEEFYAVNPDCFKFVDTVRIPDGPYETIPYYAKYHGQLSTLIEVDYLFGFDTRQDNLPIRMRTTYGLSNCGDFVKEPEYLVLKFRYGI